MTPIQAVTQADPYPYYAALVAERPFYFDDGLGMWVAGSAQAVTAILGHPGCRVRPPAEPVPPGIQGTAAGEVFGHLVRMTDGDLQRRLKAIVVDALARADHARAAALAGTRARRVLQRAPADRHTELMFGVPVQVVAALCGLDDSAAEEAGRLIADFVGCIPATATAEQYASAARAAATLNLLLGPLLAPQPAGLLGELVRAAARNGWTDRAPLLANGIGLLSQTYDATAGLIGNTLVALSRHKRARPGSPTELDRFVREVVRHDAPVQNTRRFAAAPVSYAGEQVGAGAAILLVLAAANRDPAANPDPHEFRTDRDHPAVYTFGAGNHRCPGSELAVTIATAVVAELIAAGADGTDRPPDVPYRPLANARIPRL